jgi:hypothetical protein
MFPLRAPKGARRYRREAPAVTEARSAEAVTDERSESALRRAYIVDKARHLSFW